MTLKRQLDVLDGSPAWPWYGKLALWSMLTFFLTVSSCTVLTGIDDASVKKAEAEYLKIKYEGEVAESAAELALEKQRLETLESIITEHGYGPVSARCAVEGWGNNANDRETCEDANALHAVGK